MLENKAETSSPKVGEVIKETGYVYRVYDEKDCKPSQTHELRAPKDFKVFDKKLKKTVSSGSRMAYADIAPKNCPMDNLKSLLK